LQDTPLIHEISEYIERKKLSFHTPGHQQGRGMEPRLKKLLGSKFLAGDLTEVPGLDNLRNPRGCLKKAQSLAANAYDALKTFFLVNGSTVGIEAAFLGLNKEGGKVLVANNAHISAVNGLILSGGQPVLLPTVFEPRWGIALGPDLQKAKSIIKNTAGAELICITLPNYQGIGLNAAEIREAVGTSAIPVLCDEAHGAHLFFQNRLPMSAQKEKLDIVVQSTHKTMGALTQASMLHINRADLLEPVQEALETLQTTSPSYLLLASLDAVQAQMRLNGETIIAGTWELAESLREEVRKIGGYLLLDDELTKPWLQDPGKLVISAAPLGLTGWELSEILVSKYGIIVELSDYYYSLFLITLGHSQKAVRRVVSALAEIKQDYHRKPLKPLDLDLDIYNRSGPLLLTPRQVFQAPKDRIAVQEAGGRIAGKAVTIYPPGIPLLWPGQEIRAEHLEFLEWVMRNGLPVHGLDEGNRITVIKESLR